MIKRIDGVEKFVEMFAKKYDLNSIVKESENGFIVPIRFEVIKAPGEDFPGVIELNPIILIKTGDRKAVPDLERKEARFYANRIRLRQRRFDIKEPVLKLWKKLPVAIALHIAVNGRNRPPSQNRHIITKRSVAF